MDLPFQLKFFKKLELYQYLKELDHSNSLEWKNERAILVWAASPDKHKDLGTPISPFFVADNAENMVVILPETGTNKTAANNVIYCRSRLASLAVRGYAKWDSPYENYLKFTPEGFLMGEVINEIKKGEWRYWVTYNAVRIVFWMGVLLIITEAVKSLWLIIKMVFQI